MAIPSSVTYESVVYSVTSIGNDAFSECTGMPSITIPNSVTSIGAGAFYMCYNSYSRTGLTSITIGNGVKTIGGEAFAGCYILESVHITDIAAWCEIEFANNFSNPFQYANHLYLYDKEIKDLVIPDGVTSIGRLAFMECQNLKSVTISNSVTSIGEAAFSGCRELSTVTIGNSVTSIGRDVFDYCNKITEIICYAENVPKANNNTFENYILTNTTLRVPDASIESYKSTAPWSGFEKITTLSGTIPGLPKCATPTISFVDGKLTLACETEGVEYVGKITPPAEINSNDDNVTVPTTYIITVYATKPDYNNSDVVTTEINIGDIAGTCGDINGDGVIDMQDVMYIVKYILNGKFPDKE